MKDMLISNPVLLFLEMNTKSDIWENVHVAFFHTMKVDGDWGCQIKKQDSCTKFQMTLMQYNEFVLFTQCIL